MPPLPLAAAQFAAQSGMLKPLIIGAVIIITIILLVVIIWISKQPQAGTPGGPTATGPASALLNPFIDLAQTTTTAIGKAIPKSYARGTPSSLPHCPSGYTNTGLTCYRAPASYSSDPIPATCPSGYTNTGTTCYRGPSTKGRGAGYAWKFGDPLNLSKAQQRCESQYGKNNCEQYGQIYYPKCSVAAGSGYIASGCCTCLRPANTLSGGYAAMTCPSDRIKRLGMCHKICTPGYNWTGTTCLRPASTLSGGTNVMSCDPGWELYGARCYEKCRSGYHPIGLVCWENTS